MNDMEGYKRILYAAAVVSLGSLALWTLADHWLPLAATAHHHLGDRGGRSDPQPEETRLSHTTNPDGNRRPGLHGLRRRSRFRWCLPLGLRLASHLLETTPSTSSIDPVPARLSPGKRVPCF